MARVLGLGGVFFKSADPKALADWYASHLGMTIEGGFAGLLRHEQLPPGAYSVWGAFQESTDYFDPGKQSYMINLIVDDLEGALEQVVAGGATRVGDIDESEFGRFGWFIDPAGNKVELWVPPVGMDEEQ